MLIYNFYVKDKKGDSFSCLEIEIREERNLKERFHTLFNGDYNLLQKLRKDYHLFKEPNIIWV
jgi:hypothetical protein